MRALVASIRIPSVQTALAPAQPPFDGTSASASQPAPSPSLSCDEPPLPLLPRVPTHSRVASSPCVRSNPDADPNGAWCKSKEGEGCTLPYGGVATSFWFYCSVATQPAHTLYGRSGACLQMDTALDVRLKCSNVSLYPLDVSAILPWCLRRSCANGTRSAVNNAETWCPAGYVCPSSNDAEQFPCPAGFYCLEGSTDPAPCSHDLFGVVSARNRCPQGSVSPPYGYEGLVVVLALLWLPLMMALECLHTRAIGTSCRRRRVKGKLRRAIGDVVRQQQILRALRPTHASEEKGSLVAHIEQAVGSLLGTKQPVPTSSSSAPSTSARMPRQDFAVRIEWERLSFHIGRRPVLRCLDGHVAHGELVALMGESGSGKSTLLNILGGRAGYGRISGRLDLNSRPHRPHELKHIVGFVLQAYVLFDELTVLENMLFAARLRAPHGELPSAQRRRVLGLLELLGLSEVKGFLIDHPIPTPPPPPLSPSPTWTLSPEPRSRTS